MEKKKIARIFPASGSNFGFSSSLGVGLWFAEKGWTATSHAVQEQYPAVIRHCGPYELRGNRASARHAAITHDRRDLPERVIPLPRSPHRRFPSLNVIYHDQYKSTQCSKWRGSKDEAPAQFTCIWCAASRLSIFFRCFNHHIIYKMQYSKP